MQGNHRQQQHYLLPNNSPANSQRQQPTRQQVPVAGHQIDFNGLPPSQTTASYSSQFLATSPQNYHQLLTDQQQLRINQSSQQVNQRDCWQQRICVQHSNNNNLPASNQMQLQPKQRPYCREAELKEQDDELDSHSCLGNERHLGREHYASQLRNNQIQHQLRLSNNQQTTANNQMHKHFPASSAGQQQEAGPSGLPFKQQEQATGSQQQANERALHVNFNRANRQGANEEEDEQDSRKKKYLTAKYGQQQMNLIKKRLKIEMWLHEQLQELAKGSKFEAELDDIDIELDQLLDMDDDDSRRRWLKKTLAPFEDLPVAKIDKFIGQVLDQSKLL